MNYLSADNLSKSFGTKILFEGLTLGLDRGQKAALVGRNGCGKTTLLRILAGKETSDEGSVSIRGGIRSAFLDQNPEFGNATTAFEAVFTGDDPRLRVVREYEELQSHSDPDPDKLQRVMDDMETYKAWDYEARVREILGQVGITRMDQDINELSGGQRKRLALARVLIQDPDLLILDEPTNHLDTDTIEWLEEYLSDRNMTLILVTHDRYFLDRVCNTIIEMDQGQVFKYEGSYEFFLEKREERQHREDSDTSRARNLLRTELEWLRRQPKARTTKSKARIDAAHELMVRAVGPQREGTVMMNFEARRTGNKILEIEHLSKAWGDLVILDDFSYVFKRGERIGIVGQNGMRNGWCRRITAPGLDHDLSRVGSEDFDRRRERRLGKCMCIHPQVEWPCDPFSLAHFADCLTDGDNMRLVEGIIGGAAAMARCTKGDRLGSVLGIRLAGIVGRKQPRHIDQ